MLNSIPILPDLVTSNDGRHRIGLAPPLGHIRSKPDPDSTFTRSSTGSILRIRPEQFTHQTLLTRLFPISIDLFHVIQRHAVLGEETAVNDKVTFLPLWGEDGGLRAFGFGR
jgi:hypothetical protein